MGASKIAHFKHLFWPMVCRGMGVWGTTPEPKQYFLAFCSSNTTILGTQKHLCWPLGGYSGMGVWSATPEPIQYFFVHCKHPHPRYSKISLVACGVQRCVRLGRHPRTQLAVRTPPSQVPRNTFAGLWGGTVVWVLEAPPQNPNNFFWHCPLQTPPSQVSKNTFFGVWCAEVCAFGAPPQNPNKTFGGHWG